MTDTDRLAQAEAHRTECFYVLRARQEAMAEARNLLRRAEEDFAEADRQVNILTRRLAREEASCHEK